MANPFFKFKQFTVFHDLCAMKVGTDGVLLGAWCDVEAKKRVLDIGTGTGLISLMIAQRNTDARIDGIELEPDAATQAEVNFCKSPWGDRLAVIPADFAHFALQPHEKYDLIVSNPPYFENSLKADCGKRATARHTDSLSFEDLIAGSASLLAESGRLALIYPIEADVRICEIAAMHQLVCYRRTVVRGHASAMPKRVLVEFCRKQSDVSLQETDLCQEQELIIETGRHEYTPEYIALTRAFYLKMD